MLFGLLPQPNLHLDALFYSLDVCWSVVSTHTNGIYSTINHGRCVEVRRCKAKWQNQLSEAGREK
jgi:hypothetical protein